MKDLSDGRVIESSAWIERMIWRNGLMLLFVLGLVLIVLDFEHWLRYTVLVVGGLGPGLFLIAREQNERQIEEQRRRLMPEGRKADQLPPLHPPAGTRMGDGGHDPLLLDRRNHLDPHPTPPYGTPAIAPAEVGWDGESPAVRAGRASYGVLPADDDTDE